MIAKTDTEYGDTHCTSAHEAEPMDGGRSRDI